MKKWVKYLSVGALVAVTSVVALFAGGVYLGERKMARHIEIKAPSFNVSINDAGLERGKYLYVSRGCVDCHGATGVGRAFIQDGDFYLKAPNISPGPGGVVGAYGPQDWERTIRHGVKPDGRPLFIMPSEDYNRLSDEDLAAMVAYVTKLPPVAGEPMVARVPSIVKVLYGVGTIRDAAEKIDHSLPPAATVVEDGSVKHGAYVANMCIGCHGEKMSGGKIPGAPPAWPAASNLTPGEGSSLARYRSAREFIAMLRSGRRPDGSAINEAMPFESLGALSEGDATALYEHLKRLAPVAQGNR